jgi:hypothetical protein
VFVLFVLTETRAALQERHPDYMDQMRDYARLCYEHITKPDGHPASPRRVDEVIRAYIKHFQYVMSPSGGGDAEESKKAQVGK